MKVNPSCILALNLQDKILCAYLLDSDSDASDGTFMLKMI